MSKEIKMQEFNSSGWNSWEWASPWFDDAPIQIMRDGWDMPIVTTKKDINPEANVAGLYWRETGIYRERVDAMHPAAKAQMEARGIYSLGMSAGNGSQMGGESAGWIGGILCNFR